MSLDIKERVIRTLLFPKALRTEEQGIITEEITNILGSSRRRIVYSFEDIFVDLQNALIQEIGNAETAELYYRIGKSVGTRYVLLASPKKPPKFLLGEIVPLVFYGISRIGFSVAEQIEYKNHKLVLRGKDNIICRKTGEGSNFAGMASGMLSFLSGKNIECRKTSCTAKEGICEIVCDERFEKKFMPDTKDLAPHPDYEKLNFPSSAKSLGVFQTFGSLMKHKVVTITKSGKHMINSKVLIAAETGYLNLVYIMCLKKTSADFVSKTILKSAEKIAHTLTGKTPDQKEKIKKILVLLSAFGYGVPYYELGKNKLNIRFAYHPFSKYGNEFETNVLTGFLNSTLKKKVRLKSKKRDNFDLILSYMF